MSDRIKITSIDTLSNHWGKLTNTIYGFQRADGSWQTDQREVYDHGNAATVLLFDSRRDQIVLVRQFRLPVHNEGKNGWLLEAAAGLLDGNTPETCARREAFEETGIKVTNLQHAFVAFMSPGSLTEQLHCFIGNYTGPITTHQAGLAEEGEDIEVVEMPFEEAFSMIKSGEIVDAKTIMLLQHLAIKRLSK